MTEDMLTPVPSTPPLDGVASAALEGPSGELERAVDYVVTDCLFAFGQAVGMRMTADYDVVMWLRDHYREKFLKAMQSFGNRWAEDRENVTGAAMMLGERAVRYAGSRNSIDLASAMKAAADVQRFCQLHARRHVARSGRTLSEGTQPRIAGYWCTDDDYGKR